MSRHAEQFAPEIGARIAGDGDVFQLRGVGSGKTGRGGGDREAGPVFDAIEALFFDGHREDAVLQQCGRGVAVISVESENIHWLFLSRIRSSRWISTRRRNQNACMKWKMAPCLPSRNPSRRK